MCCFCEHNCTLLHCVKSVWLWLHLTWLMFPQTCLLHSEAFWLYLFTIRKWSMLRLHAASSGQPSSTCKPQSVARINRRLNPTSSSEMRADLYNWTAVPTLHTCMHALGWSCAACWAKSKICAAVFTFSEVGWNFICAKKHTVKLLDFLHKQLITDTLHLATVANTAPHVKTDRGFVADTARIQILVS